MCTYIYIIWMIIIKHIQLIFYVIPGFIDTSSLNLAGKERNNLTWIERPIRVAIEQCGIVGYY